MRGYDLLVSFQQLSADWHTDYEDSRKADGLILLGYGDYRDYAQRLGQLAEQGTHFVRWGAVQPGQQETVVGCDNVEGGREVTAHLIERGRSRIAFIGKTDKGSPEFRDRHIGYKAALKDAGLAPPPGLHVDAISTEESGHDAAVRLMRREVPFDAIVCASDLMAIGAIRALAESGRRVPDDVAVTGFDDILAAGFCNPPLTTVTQDARAAGERAGRHADRSCSQSIGGERRPPCPHGSPRVERLAYARLTPDQHPVPPRRDGQTTVCRNAHRAAIAIVGVASGIGPIGEPDLLRFAREVEDANILLPSFSRTKVKTRGWAVLTTGTISAPQRPLCNAGLVSRNAISLRYSAALDARSPARRSDRARKTSAAAHCLLPARCRSAGSRRR